MKRPEFEMESSSISLEKSEVSLEIGLESSESDLQNLYKNNSIGRTRKRTSKLSRLTPESE